MSSGTWLGTMTKITAIELSGHLLGHYRLKSMGMKQHRALVNTQNRAAAFKTRMGMLATRGFDESTTENRASQFCPKKRFASMGKLRGLSQEACHWLASCHGQRESPQGAELQREIFHDLIFGFKPNQTLPCDVKA